MIQTVEARDELPPLASFVDHAIFTQVLPSSRQVPAAPRFTFGVMPAPLSAEYYSRQMLAPTGIYAAPDITLSDGLLLRSGAQLLVAPEMNFQRAHIGEAIGQFGAPATSVPVTRLAGPHALIVGPGYKIYGHWLAEILPKLGVLHAAGHDLDTLKLLVPDDVPAFALEMLGLLGFHGEQIVRFGGGAGPVMAEQLLTCSFLHNAVRYSAILHGAVSVWRRRLEARHGRLAQGGYPARIMLARRSGSRRLLNRAEIEESCATAGFTVVVPERLGLLEQWRMFADAREIIGEYGSALHASLFSAPGTVVCGLRGSELHPAFIQSGIGDRLFQPTGYVFGAMDDTPSGSFDIRPQDLAACLSSVFSGNRLPVGSTAVASGSKPVATAADFVAEHDRLVEEGQWDAAMQAARRAVALNPDEPGAFARLAVLLARTNAPGALGAINRAVAAGETSVDNLLLRANILLRRGQVADALRPAETAVRNAPEDAAAYGALANILLHNGRPQEGASAARRAIILDPAAPENHLTLFTALFDLGLFEEAERVIRAVHASAPKFPGVAASMVRVLVQGGQMAEALPLALSALAEDPAKPEMRALLGAMLHAISGIHPEQRMQDVQPARDDAVLVREAFTVDFSASGNSAAHRANGWSRQEPKRVWAIGERSVLALPRLDPSRDWTMAMDLAACILPPTVRRQRLSVCFNGTELLARAITRACTIDAFIPKDLLGPGRQTALRLHHPDCVSPKDLGVNKDPRLLAVCLHSIRFAPVNSRT